MGWGMPNVQKGSSVPAVLFILATMPSLPLMIEGFSYLAQRYPNVINVIPGIEVEFDPVSGRYIFIESWGMLLYPVLVLALLTVIFLRKTEFQEGSFLMLGLVVPFFVVITISVVEAVFNGGGENNFGFLAAYLLFTSPYLLGIIGHYLLSRMVW